MALANFFNKTALAASHVLQNFDVEQFGDILVRQCIGVAFDSSAAISPEARALLSLLVNLLSRLYPRIALLPTGGQAEALCPALVAQARLINPEIELTSKLGDVTLCLALQSAVIRGQFPVIYLASRGWIACLSSAEPLKCGQSKNPFGPGAAACFGVANAFRYTFSEHLPSGGLDDALRFSTLHFDRTSTLRSKRRAIDLGELHLIGAGAIGNGAVWALSRMPDLSGRIVIIDPEEVDMSNLQRYVLCDQGSIGRRKVEVLGGVLKESSLDSREHFGTWGSYLSCRDDYMLDRVAVAVDSAEDRRAVQAALPRWIANAWTQPENIGVSRHTFLDDQACLCCLYWPSGAQKSRDEIIAEAIGLPGAKEEVRSRLQNIQPTDADLLRRIADALHVPLDPLLQFEGRPLQDFYSQAICGGLILRLGNRDNDPAQVQAPMSFQSCLAGILLAAEVVAHAGALRQESYPVRSTINLLRPLRSSEFSFAQAKHPSCICQDPDYQAIYQAKYGV